MPRSRRSSADCYRGRNASARRAGSEGQEHLPAVRLSKGGCAAAFVAAWFDRLTTRIEVGPADRDRSRAKPRRQRRVTADMRVIYHAFNAAPDGASHPKPGNVL